MTPTWTDLTLDEGGWLLVDEAANAEGRRMLLRPVCILCRRCADRIAEVLPAVSGVSRAHLSWREGLLEVWYQPHAVTAAQGLLPEEVEAVRAWGNRLLEVLGEQVERSHHGVEACGAVTGPQFLV